MSTVVTVGGSPVAIPRTIVAARLVPYTKGGVGSFSFATRGGPMALLPDPYLGKAVTVTVNGTLRFFRQVASRHPTFTNGVGWVTAYQCVDLRHLGDHVPHTDSQTGMDQSSYNVPKDNDPQGWVAARAGRTAGQILTGVLTMPVNAQGLSGFGIGNYTGLPSSPALPSATAADLAALTFIPPGRCRSAARSCSAPSRRSSRSGRRGSSSASDPTAHCGSSTCARSRTARSRWASTRFTRRRCRETRPSVTAGCSSAGPRSRRCSTSPSPTGGSARRRSPTTG